MQREVLIAYQMNGRDLPLDHGYPLRATVPGHYGMASQSGRLHFPCQPEFPRCARRTRTLRRDFICDLHGSASQA
jgi:DMSO/TMAO reductase YedYZ molybdopterin-dependent catalytic subunit